MKEQAKNLIEQLELCVVSSISPEGTPQSALVGFSINDKFEVMIGTSKKSRKFRNVASDPHVSIVFGPFGKRAVQYEGIARVLEGAELAERKLHHFKLRPNARQYESDPDQTYILVEPKWMRLVESGPTNLGEMEFGL